MKKPDTTAGFTVIEVIVTLVIAVVFVLAINTLFITIIRSTASARNQANASTVTYSYLRKYAYANAPYDWFNCNDSTNLQTNPNAPGETLDSGSLDATQTTLPQPVTYSIQAYAPYGCDDTNTGTPLLVRATITYGTDTQTVQHATYVERTQ